MGCHRPHASLIPTQLKWHCTICTDLRRLCGAPHANSLARGACVFDSADNDGTSISVVRCPPGSQGSQVRESPPSQIAARNAELAPILHYCSMRSAEYEPATNAPRPQDRLVWRPCNGVSSTRLKQVGLRAAVSGRCCAGFWFVRTVPPRLVPYCANAGYGSGSGNYLR